MTMRDVLVVGKGPAGLALAAELAERGLAVSVMGPAGPAYWPATYAAWTDELAGTAAETAVKHRWDAVALDAGQGRVHTLRRGYGVLDNQRLASSLVLRCAAAGVAWADGEAAGASHTAGGSEVARRDGPPVSARIVVDATGHRPALLRRPEGPAPAYQTAVGRVLRLRAAPPLPGATLMDWSTDHLPRGRPDDGVASPSFLYAFDLGGGRFFAEETVLAARPAVSHDVLARRLDARLAYLGVAGAEVEEDEERVWIPMGAGLPEAQRVVGFGAAAGLVHPATGYSVSRSLRLAPALAETIAASLGRGETAEETARAAWEVVLPADARRRHAVHRFGMEMLLGLDAAAAGDFFDAFCRMGEDGWRGYLGDALGPAALAAVMARFFAAAPGGIRRALSRGAVGPHGRALARALAGA